MSWTIGTGQSYNIGRQADERFPALVSASGEKLLHFGASQQRHTEAFNYQDASIERFGLVATRYANFRGRLLANDGTLLTDTWAVGFAPFMIRPKQSIIVTAEVTERIKQNIEAALLSHPLWPSNYGRPDLPVKYVKFVVPE